MTDELRQHLVATGWIHHNTAQVWAHAEKSLKMQAWEDSSSLVIQLTKDDRTTVSVVVNSEVTPVEVTLQHYKEALAKLNTKLEKQGKQLVKRIQEDEAYLAENNRHRQSVQALELL